MCHLGWHLQRRRDGSNVSPERHGKYPIERVSESRLTLLQLRENATAIIIRNYDHQIGSSFSCRY
jgi:hypothetical protein